MLKEMYENQCTFKNPFSSPLKFQGQHKERETKEK